MQEADMGLTSQAMGGQNGRFQGDEHLLVRFYMHSAQDKEASKEEGRPIFREVPYVHIMQPGNKESIIHRKATDMDKQRFAEHFRKFEARLDQDAVEGTLLDEWGGITRSQCEELKFFNIRTVEQLAELSDSNAQNIMGVQMLKQKAAKFLETSESNATAEKFADLQSKYEALLARLDGEEEEVED